MNGMGTEMNGVATRAMNGLGMRGNMNQVAQNKFVARNLCSNQLGLISRLKESLLYHQR